MSGTKVGSVAATSDNLGGTYSAMAKDKSASPKQREAAMLFNMAEGHLTEEEDEQAVQTAREALDLFREQSNEVAVADCIRLICHVLCYQDQRKEAGRLAQEELDRMSGKDKGGEARIRLALAEINAEKRGKKNREQALSNLLQAQDTFKEQGDKRMEALSLIVQMNLCVKRKGDPKKSAEEAIAAAKKAQALFKELGDQRGEATALHGTAAAHVKALVAKEELEKGAWLEAAQAAAKLFQELRLRKLEAWERCCIAQWTLLENPRAALRLAQEALQLCRELGSSQEAMALGLVVSAHLEIKDTSKAWMIKEASAAVKVAKDGVRRFRSKGDKFGEGQALIALLLAYLGKEDHEQALKIADQAQGLFEDLRDATNEALVLQLSSQLLLKNAQPDKAMAAARKAMNLSQGGVERMLALEGVYEVHMKNGEYGKAVAVAKELEALAEDQREVKKVAVAKLLQCNGYFHQEDYSTAEILAREAQSILIDAGAMREAAEALRFVAEVHIAARDFQSALGPAERGKRYLLEAGDEEGAAGLAFLVAQVRLLMLVQGRGEIPDAKVDPDFAQECEEALEYADEAVSMAKQSGNKKLLASVLCTVAQMQTAAMDTEKAFAAVDEAMSIFRAAEDQANTAAVMCIESDIHLVSGNMNKALSIVNKALTIFREIGDERGAWVALGIVEHITGPEEEEITEEAWTQESLNQATYERWLAMQQAEEAQQLATQDLGAGQAAQALEKKKRAPKELTSERLDSSSLSIELVSKRLQDIVMATVEGDEDEEFELDKPLMQMGVTSKTAVAMRNALTEELPTINLPHTLVFDYPTINMMSELIMDQTSSLQGRKKKLR